MPSICFPLKTINPLNAREHWGNRIKRVRNERDVTAWMLFKLPKPALPVRVLLTRIAARQMDDDGLSASFKGVRDQVAFWLGVDDADPRIEWRYAQQKGKGFHVQIELLEMFP